MTSPTIIPLEDKALPTECYVFKHSTRCPVSTAAASVVRLYQWGLPLYWVNVVEQRELSGWVADSLGVRHESPQLIRISAGKASGVLNHSAIQATSIDRM
ncbi:MAG: DUF2847 family protein [Deltaproteobacteria bacterium]|nr:DUF2847 family protein [Deltaproteobacteria bacterium]